MSQRFILLLTACLALPPAPPLRGAAPPAKAAAPRTDRYGDPLPPGASARLGTLRFRHPGGIDALAFAPDGKTLATGGGDGVRLWELRTGKELRRVACRGWFWPRVMAFSPNGKTLAASGGNCGIRLWDLPSGKERPTCGHEGTVAALHFTLDGKALWSGPAEPVLGDGDNTLRLWDLGTGDERRLLVCGPREFVTCAAFAAGGKVVAAGGWDARDRGLVWVWDGDTGKRLHRFEEHQGLSDVALSPDGRTVACWVSKSSHGEAAEVRLRDLRTGKLLSRFRLPTQGLNCQLAWSPDGKHLATLGSDGGVCLRETTTGRVVRTFRGPGDEPVAAFVFSGDGRSLAADCVKDGTALIQIWDVAGGRERVQFEAPFPIRDEVLVIGTTLAFSPDGRTLAVGVWETEVSLWEVATGKVRRRYTGHRFPVRSAAFSPDGRTLATGSEDCTICLWDLPGRATRGPVEALWRRLAEDDPEKAYEAMWGLVAAPTQAVPLLKRHLRPAAPVADKRLNRLITDLNDEEFAVREEATSELGRLGDLAEPALRAALARTKSLELRRRIKGLLQSLDRPASGDQLRDLRAVEALEYIGTPEAREVLRGLARGAPAARLTQEAKAALVRLERRPVAKP